VHVVRLGDEPAYLVHVADWLAEHQARARQRLQRARAVGAIVEFERTVPLESGRVRVVGTLADATQTVLLYQSPEHPMLWPRAVGPPSLIGGASGTIVDDVRVAQLPAVDVDVTTIVVSFDTPEGEAVEVELPVDRSRARPFERRAHDLPSTVVVEGVTVRVMGAAVGLLTATIDLEVTSEDVEVAGVVLGRRMSRHPHPHRRAGAGPLWREWHPPSGGTPAWASLRLGRFPARGIAGATVRSSAIATATSISAGQEAPRWREPPPPGWRVRGLPGRELLAVQGMQGSGGPVPDSVSEQWTLRFDPPATTVRALELALDELLVYRTAPSEFVSVPPPTADHPVDLGGFVLSCGAERFRLLRWEPIEQGSFTLVLAGVPRNEARRPSRNRPRERESVAPPRRGRRADRCPPPVSPGPL
jgi:hypothetical protein